MEYKHFIADPDYKDTWSTSFANELGQLFQGIRDIDGTNTCYFIPVTAMPEGRKAMYGKLVCHVQLEKKEKN